MSLEDISFLEVLNWNFELRELFSWKENLFAGVNWKLPFMGHCLADVVNQLHSQVIIVTVDL